MVAKLKEEVQEALTPTPDKDAPDRARFVADLQARGQALLLEVEDSMQRSMATQPSPSPAAPSRQGPRAKAKAHAPKRERCQEEPAFFWPAKGKADSRERCCWLYI